MFVLDAFLEPISPEQPSGPDLRYDAVTDQIREARTVEDETLPMGQWSHQAARADYELAEALTSNVLLERSKDLWFAAWLGEASLRLHGYRAIEPVFRLLHQLQQHFWSSLHPQIEDDDVSLRAAPLQWTMQAYAGLIHALPVTANGIPYSLFHRLRAGGVAPENSEYLAPEDIETSIAETSRTFSLEARDALQLGREALMELSSFCDARYGEDSPSFVEVRAALEDVLNVHVQILRQNPEEEPRAISTGSAEDEAQFTPEIHQADEFREIEPALEMTNARVRNVAAVQIESWQSMQQVLQQCMDFCIQQEPGDTSALFVALALARVHLHASGQKSASPSSEVRLALKRAADAGEFSSLLQETLSALGTPFGTTWLDAYRYLHVATTALGAWELEEMILPLVRALVGTNPAIAEEVFEDGTPAASRETASWIESEVIPKQETAETVDIPVAQLVLPVAPTKTSDDLYERASDLARQGAVKEAARLLLDDASALRSGRGSFLRRIELSRLLLREGQIPAANAILDHLLAVVDERKLETWEDSGVIAELLTMHLQSSQGQAEDAQRRAVFQRLFQVDPSLALSAQILMQRAGA